MPFIIVAGGKRQGRSTTLNNIFGVDFPVSDASDISTRDIAVREVRIDQRTYIIVDTPGFEGINAELREKVADAIRGLDFTLLYCVTINPGNILSETDKSILIKFQNCAHDRIWEKCVLLLTYSDHAVRNFIGGHSPEKAAQNFKVNVREHALAFGAVLNQISSSKIQVHTVFEYKDEYTRINAGFSGIVAVPVRSQLDATREDGNFNRAPDIIPGIPTIYSWQDVAWSEINNKITPLKGELTTKNFATTVGTTFAGGIVIGAGVGALIGVVGGPIGMVIGGALGAVAENAFGLVTYFITGVGASNYLKWMRVNPDDKIKRLREKLPQETYNRII